MSLTHQRCGRYKVYSCALPLRRWQHGWVGGAWGWGFPKPYHHLCRCFALLIKLPPCTCTCCTHTPVVWQVQGLQLHLLRWAAPNRLVGHGGGGRPNHIITSAAALRCWSAAPLHLNLLHTHTHQWCGRYKGCSCALPLRRWAAPLGGWGMGVGFPQTTSSPLPLLCAAD